MIRFRRMPKTRRRSSERTQRIAIIVVMAGLAGSLVLLGREVVTGPSHPPVKMQTAARALADTPKAPQDEEIYTGSILFMPPSGDTCRQYLFDNISGRLSDNGMVDCMRAAYHPASAPPKKWSAERVHVIRDGFRER
jgi:hypothetical protein